jgi:hypothetical protein
VGSSRRIVTARQTAVQRARRDGMEPPKILGRISFFLESYSLCEATTLL